MKGLVKYVNVRLGLCAIELSSNNFTIFEDFDECLSVGDIVSGHLESLGGETLHNKSKDTEVDGFAQNYGCSLDQLERQFR